MTYSDDWALDYIRKLENPNKVGWDGKVWRTPKGKGYDNNQIAYGLDIRKENNPLVYNFLKDKGRLKDPWLTDAEAKLLMQQTYAQKQSTIRKAIKLAGGNVSLRGYEVLLGMNWHGDPMKKALDKDSITGKAFRKAIAEGDQNFDSVFDTYYNYGNNKTRFAARIAADKKHRPKIDVYNTETGKKMVIPLENYELEQFLPSFQPAPQTKTVYPLNNKVPTSISSWSGADAPNATPRMPSLQENLGRSLKDMWDLFDRNAVAYGRDRTALNLDLPPLEDLFHLNSPEEQLKHYIASTLEVPLIQLDMPMLLPVNSFKHGKLPRYEDGDAPINGGIPFAVTVTGRDRRPAWRKMYENPNLTSERDLINIAAEEEFKKRHPYGPNGKPVEPGLLIVSPEFELLSGVRGMQKRSLKIRKNSARKAGIIKYSI